MLDSGLARLWTISYITITKFKVVELTQIWPTPFKGGTSSNINIQKSQYDQQRDLIFLGHKDWPKMHAFLSIRTYKHFIVNTITLQEHIWNSYETRI